MRKKAVGRDSGLVGNRGMVKGGCKRDRGRGNDRCLSMVSRTVTLTIDTFLSDQCPLSLHCCLYLNCGSIITLYLYY